MTWHPLVEDESSILYVGECLDALRALPDCSVDSLVTDPPAGISFMAKEWDSDKGGRDAWIAWLAEIARETLRVLKPGAHGLVWALPRTSHWTATALENAGFEVRDIHHHLFGTGFPKSLNVSKEIDRLLGKIDGRPVLGKVPRARATKNSSNSLGEGWQDEPDLTAPATDEARAWDGWGTALKPAAEHWILVRKPLDGTVAANVLVHGTGALNIDACRIETDENLNGGAYSGAPREATGTVRFANRGIGEFVQPPGRWPANFILSHADECEEVGEREVSRSVGHNAGPVDVPPTTIGPTGLSARRVQTMTTMTTTAWRCAEGCPVEALRRMHEDAPDFFYCAKPSRRERDLGCESLPRATAAEATGREEGSDGLKSPRAGAGRTGGGRNTHPTVKPVELMRYLVRLVTPPGGIVLDPFAGSGTTGMACAHEGFRFIGAELLPEHAAIAARRIQAAHLLARGEK